MRHDNLATVHSTLVLGHAETIRDRLRAEGIPCILGGIVRGRGRGIPDLDIQILVPAASFGAARRFIASQDLSATESGLERAPLDAEGLTTLAGAGGQEAGTQPGH
jgi:hypothetical protein